MDVARTRRASLHPQSVPVRAKPGTGVPFHLPKGEEGPLPGCKSTHPVTNSNDTEPQPEHPTSSGSKMSVLRLGWGIPQQR